jgi:putative addiction module component (TIGR02574 family)
MSPREFAASLTDGPEEASQQDLDAAWAAEILRRIEDLESGRVKPLSWASARQMITGEPEGSMR